MRTTLLALASGAAAQTLLPSNPGGAVPVGVQAPSIAGFQNSTIGISRGGLAVCVSGHVLVSANSTNNIKFNYTLPANQSQLTETLLEVITPGSPFTTEIVEGKATVVGTYSIGATLCTPANDTKPKGVQLLSHGIGFDRYYWDFAPGYSYVDVAVENGYAAFFYDRLGVGTSSKPDAISVVQAPLEVEILHNLAFMLRTGIYSNTTFSSVVGVGHSFGSIRKNPRTPSPLTNNFSNPLTNPLLRLHSHASSNIPTPLRPRRSNPNRLLRQLNRPASFRHRQQLRPRQPNPTLPLLGPLKRLPRSRHSHQQPNRLLPRPRLRSSGPIPGGRDKRHRDPRRAIHDLGRYGHGAELHSPGCCGRWGRGPAVLFRELLVPI